MPCSSQRHSVTFLFLLNDARSVMDHSNEKYRHARPHSHTRQCGNRKVFFRLTREGIIRTVPIKRIFFVLRWFFGLCDLRHSRPRLSLCKTPDFLRKDSLHGFRSSLTSAGSTRAI